MKKFVCMKWKCLFNGFLHCVWLQQKSEPHQEMTTSLKPTVAERKPRWTPPKHPGYSVYLYPETCIPSPIVCHTLLWTHCGFVFRPTDLGTLWCQSSRTNWRKPAKSEERNRGSVGSGPVVCSRGGVLYIPDIPWWKLSCPQYPVTASSGDKGEEVPCIRALQYTMLLRFCFAGKRNHWSFDSCPASRVSPIM